MNLTRRTLAKIMAAAAVPAASIEPMAAAPQIDGDEETRSAHDALHNALDQIAKIDVPMATEPAFLFKA